MMHRVMSQILLEAAARAMVAALVLWLGMRLLRVANAATQKTAWTMVLCAAMAMPVFMLWQWRPAWAIVNLQATSWTRWMPAAPKTKLPVASAASGARALQADHGQSSAAADRFPGPRRSLSDFDQFSRAESKITETPAIVVRPLALEDGRPPQAKRRFAWLTGAGWLGYLAVTTALLLRLLLGLASSIRLWMDARVVGPQPDACATFDWAVRCSEKIASPVNIGSGILLPADYARWDDAKLRVVLAHETSHIRQRDFYLQLLAGLYTAVVWFSPLGWWLKRKLADLSEAISDRAGLQAAASPVAYAEVLLEFAALPRPTLAGVAMAHSTNLHERIERLFSESTSSRVLGGKQRTAVALLLPAVLIAATALVHVQAAAIPAQNQPAQATPTPAETAPTPAGPAGQSHPDRQAAGAGSSQTPETGQQEPPAIPAPASAPAPAAEGAPIELFAEPLPKIVIVPPIPPVTVTVPPVDLSTAVDGIYALKGPDGIYAIQDFEGDAYAVVGDPGSSTMLSGRWNQLSDEEVQKARKIAHGHFLLFRHNGKDYVVDDPAIVSQIEEMQAAVRDRREKMQAMEKQIRDAAEQAREEGRKAREIAAANVTVPDLSKEMAELNETVAELKSAQGGTVPREKLQEVQRQISALQALVINAEINSDLHVNVDEVMKNFNAEQGMFGEQLGQLGAQLGQTARENREKIDSIIQESLKNGKAKPVN